jgi:hypothetical protein
MARFRESEVERHVRKMKVVGYVDLRPVNWFTGKREPLRGAPLRGAPLRGAPLRGAPLRGAPLAAGEGHICDRCGAEHAIVYTLLDTDSKEEFKVGSGCAQRAFGFDPDKDPLVRKTIKAEKQRIEKEMERQQDEVVSLVASTIAKDVMHLPLPFIEWLKVEKDLHGYNMKWRMGDVVAWGYGLKSADKIPDERLNCLIRGFFTNEVVGRLPEPYKSAQFPSPEYATARKIAQEAMRLLFVAKRVK